MRNPLITAFPTLTPGVLAASPARESTRGSWEHDPALLSSARAGVFHAVRHLGVARPSKVLVPSYHCGVEIEAVLRAGAAIAYYAVDRNMRVSVDEVARRMDPDVRALFVVHYWGFPQDIESLARFCRDNDLLLIEDCAHALFSAAGERPLGTTGDAAVYSLPKTLPTPEGGILVARDVARRLSSIEPARRTRVAKATARSLLDHLRSARAKPMARIADGLLALKQRVSVEDPGGLGDYGESPLSPYDRRMSGVSEYIFRRSSGRHIRDRRRENYRHLVERIEPGEGLGVVFARLPAGVCPLFCPVFVDDRSSLQAHLRQENVETFVFGRNLHPTLSRDDFTDAAFLSDHVLGLPVHQGLSDQDVQVIAQSTNAWIRR